MLVGRRPTSTMSTIELYGIRHCLASFWRQTSKSHETETTYMWLNQWDTKTAFGRNLMKRDSYGGFSLVMTMSIKIWSVSIASKKLFRAYMSEELKCIMQSRAHLSLAPHLRQDRVFLSYVYRERAVCTLLISLVSQLKAVLFQSCSLSLVSAVKF